MFFIEHENTIKSSGSIAYTIKKVYICKLTLNNMVLLILNI